MALSGSGLEQSGPPHRRFGGWRVALAGAFVLAIAGNGGDGQGLPKLIGAVFGDLRSVHTDVEGFRLGFTLLTGLIPALLLPFVGWATDRWGSRRMVMCGMIALAAGLLMYLVAHVSAALYLAVAVFGIGGAVGSRVPMATAVNHWFRRRRATAMAVMLLPSVMAFVLGTALAVGGRLLTLVNPQAALILIAVMLLALAWPLWKLVKNRPEEYGQHPDGVEPSSAHPDQAAQSAGGELVLPDYQWREALKTRAFWLMVAGDCGPGIAAFGMFFSPVLVVDHGFVRGHASGLVMSSAIIAVPFVIVGGVLGDRLPIRWMMFVFAVLGSVAVGMLAFATTLPMFYLSTALSGVGSGGLAPLTFVARGVYFGRRNYGTITGLSLLILYTVPQLAGLLIALMLGFEGNFTPALVTMGLVSTLVSLGFLFLGNPKPSPSQVKQIETQSLIT